MKPKRPIFSDLAVLLIAMVLIVDMNESTAAEKPAAMARLSLQDVQGLWGGRNVYINGDGTLWVQVVARGLQEQRYKLTLTAAQLAEIEKLLTDNHFAEIQIKQRPGVPDEARPAIRLATTDGKTVEKVKWANDKNPEFDAIYRKLVSLAPAKGTQTPVFEGKYDYDWRPEGFGK